MRDLAPEYLVPSHTRPLFGEELIYETLTNYRDAIQFVHDQTIRGMNQGLTPNEIVERVKLPPHLAGLPYLHEYYGTVEWAVKAIFDGYLGWFGGNATDLFPLAVKERARRFADLAGGNQALLEATRKAAEAGDHQWVLELTDQLMALETDLAEARDLKSASLTALGENQIAATGRNYYLTQALEVSGRLKIGQVQVKNKEMVHSIPLDSMFNSMAVRLNPEKSADIDQIVGFRFPDTGEAYTVHVRRGIAEIRPRLPENPEISVTVSSHVWKEIGAQMRNPAAALLKGDIKIEGGTFNLVKFLGLFEVN
jgi:alkyl sulfatase BDS1-like metallo-beta-lactamase superfamily hydrolase